MPAPACPFLSRHRAAGMPPRSGQPARTIPRVNRPGSLTHPSGSLTPFSRSLTLPAPGLTLLSRKLTLFGKIARTVSDVSTPSPAGMGWRQGRDLLLTIAVPVLLFATVRLWPGLFGPATAADKLSSREPVDDDAR